MSREILRAILKNDKNKLNTLINQGINIDEVTEKEKWNYLHRALMTITMVPAPEIINYLIQNGVDVNAIDIYGNTPLHYAARLKNSQIIEVLLSVANIEVNHINNDGVNPLREMLLSKPFDYDSIKLILEAGADKEQKVDGGISVKSFANTIANGDSTLINLFA